MPRTQRRELEVPRLEVVRRDDTRCGLRELALLLSVLRGVRGVAASAGRGLLRLRRDDPVAEVCGLRGLVGVRCLDDGASSSRLLFTLLCDANARTLRWEEVLIDL